MSEEKAVVLERYFAPQAKEASGLQDTDVVPDRVAVDVLIGFCCEESRVRDLEKHIGKVRFLLPPGEETAEIFVSGRFIVGLRRRLCRSWLILEGWEEHGRRGRKGG